MLLRNSNPKLFTPGIYRVVWNRPSSARGERKLFYKEDPTYVRIETVQYVTF